MINIGIKGAAQTLKSLQALDEKTMQRALGAGLTQAAKPGKKAVEGKTPIEEHILAKTVSHRTLNKRQKSALGLDEHSRGVQIGFLKQTMDYRIRKIVKRITLAGLAGILQGGAKPHVIKPRKDNKTGRLRLRDGRVLKKVNHPGVKPRYLFTKAYQSMGNIQRPFYEGLRRYLERKKLA